MIKYSSINTKQNTDAGMALVLILLLIGLFAKWLPAYKLATLAVVITMTIPNTFKPFSFVWYNFSQYMGKFMSTLLLSLVYIILVLPVGIIRRLIGKDILKLKSFKINTNSAFIERNHTYIKEDLEKPY